MVLKRPLILAVFFTPLFLFAQEEDPGWFEEVFINLYNTLVGPIEQEIFETIMSWYDPTKQIFEEAIAAYELIVVYTNLVDQFFPLGFAITLIHVWIQIVVTFGVIKYILKLIPTIG